MSGNDGGGPPTKTPYDLGLHEELSTTNNWVVIRVPGGWIYTHWEFRQQDKPDPASYSVEQWTEKHSVFVPYSNQAKEEQLELLLNLGG